MLYNYSPATIHTCTLLYCFYHLAGAGAACMQGRWVLLLEAPRRLTCTPTDLPAYCYTSQTEAAAFFSRSSRAKLLCFSFYYTKQHVKLCPVCKNYALLTMLSTQRQVFFRTSKTSTELLKLLLTDQQSRLHIICNGNPASNLQPTDLFTPCSTE